MFHKNQSIFGASALLSVLILVILVGVSRAEENASDTDSLAQVQKVIANGVTRNWISPSKVPAVGPRIRIRLNRDGSLDGPPEIENPSDDPAFNAYADSARRAIYRAAPFDLAAQGSTYEQWKSVVLPFLSETETAAAQPAMTTTAAPADAPTDVNLLQNFKAIGMEVHALTFYKELEDGTPTLVLAACGVGANEGSYVFGVDFGQGPTWTEPETVHVTFGSYRKSHRMQVMREYLNVEGTAAKGTIAALVNSSGKLTFSGPRGLSLSFELDGATEELAGLKSLCKL